MQEIKNTQGINNIKMKPIAFTKCAIGQDWYENKLEIDFEPDECYPDYMEVNDFIMKEIDGKELNIEDVVDMIYNMLQSNYKPKSLTVTDYIENCKTHFNVTVTK